jgi:hypothetical protein
MRCKTGENDQISAFSRIMAVTALFPLHSDMIRRSVANGNVRNFVLTKTVLIFNITCKIEPTKNDA